MISIYLDSFYSQTLSEADVFQTLVLFKKESTGCVKSLSSSASVALQEKVQPDPPGVSQAAGVALVS